MVFFLPICLLCHFFSSSESLTMASSWVGVSSMSDDLSLRLKCEPTERSWFITATWTTSTYTSVSCTSTLFIFNFTTVPRQREWYKVGIQTVLDTLANRLREWGAQGLWWVITCPHPLWNTDAIRTSRRTEELPGATVTTLTPYGFWRGEKRKITFHKGQFCDRNLTKPLILYRLGSITPILDLRWMRLKKFIKQAQGSITGEQWTCDWTQSCVTLPTGATTPPTVSLSVPLQMLFPLLRILISSVLGNPSLKALTSISCPTKKLVT